MINERNTKVNYSDLIELGFKKEYLTDYVHEAQSGYPYFILAYGEDTDQVCMEWSPVSREVNLYINAHTYQKGLTLDEVKNVVDMLSENLFED